MSDQKEVEINNEGVIVRPFKGWHPDPDIMHEVACPPFDTLDSDEAREMAKGNEKSFLRCNKPEIDLDPNIDPYSDAVYQKGKENLELFCAKGWLKQDKKTMFYIYSQQMGSHIQYGLVCEVSAEQYDKDIIKKHELTRKKKEDDRTKLTDTQSANEGPIFICYKQLDIIDKIINNIVTNNKSYAKFASKDKTIHQLWMIEDDQIIENLQKLFHDNVTKMYIADGHHRSASACRVYKERKAKLMKEGKYTGNEDFNYFLAVLFPHNQLKIMDYNRICFDLNNMTSDEFLKTLSENGWVYNKVESHDNMVDESMLKPAKKHHFAMYLHSKGWYTLRPTDEIITKSEQNIITGLDSSILSDYLLTPILNIQDLRTANNIEFLGGIHGFKGLEKKIKKLGNGVAFGMCPTSIEELMQIADENKIMPPKSTWFEPKLRSGVVVRRF